MVATDTRPPVPASGDAAPTRVSVVLPESAVRHRQDWWAYIRGDPAIAVWHREHLLRLIAFWEEANAAHFGGALTPPYALLAEPAAPNVYGDCSPVSGFGGRSQIRLRPSLLTGAHPDVRAGDDHAEGRSRVVADVLLHEMPHQLAQEVTDEREEAYHGHGPKFRDVCNRIGAALGLPPVRTAKARGKDKDLPSCAHWPHNVRPVGYYLGAYLPSAPAAASPTPIPPSSAEAKDEVARAADELRRRFTPAQQRALLGRLAGGVNLSQVIRRAIEAEPALLSGPRDLLPHQGPEYAASTIEHLRFTWAGACDDARRVRQTLDEVRAARIWERYPPERPYGSLDALCRAELGVSECELENVPASGDREAR